MTAARLRIALESENESDVVRDDPEAQTLALEHRRLGRHLADVDVTPYQIAKYLDFHRRRALAPRNEFDALLLRLSRAGKLGLVLADAYSGTLYRVCLVRMKLMLTLAILESSAPSFHVLDAPDPGKRLVFFRMAASVALAFVALVVAASLLAPVQIWFAAKSRAKE
jgi:hypothetical protein